MVATTTLTIVIIYSTSTLHSALHSTVHTGAHYTPCHTQCAYKQNFRFIYFHSSNFHNLLTKLHVFLEYNWDLAVVHNVITWKLLRSAYIVASFLFYFYVFMMIEWMMGLDFPNLCVQRSLFSFRCWLAFVIVILVFTHLFLQVWRIILIKLSCRHVIYFRTRCFSNFAVVAIGGIGRACLCWW